MPHKIYIWILSTLFLCSSCSKGQTSNIIIEHKNSLCIYYPQYSKIDLVTGNMPSPDDESVIMCCAAAFTGELLDTFDHKNIAGNHVSNGKYYEGYHCKVNTGCFAYNADNGIWTFAMGDYIKHIAAAADHNGCAFGQVMLIHNGKLQPIQAQRDSSRQNQYRVLAEYNNKLCVIDCKKVMSYKDFIDALMNIGVTHALYLDMGAGWNYSFYRDNDNSVHFIHNHRIPYTTNWITFYK